MQIKKPIRVKHTYKQQLEAPPADVFPLLCPVRECEWVEGWDPKIVLSNSGIAEQDCVFVTPDGEREATWVITAYKPDKHIAFVKITPEVLFIKLEIDLRPAGDNGCEAIVSYTYTALNEEGEQRVKNMTEEAYTEYMQSWEAVLNAFLA